MENTEKNYIHRGIAKAQTDKRLIEMQDNLDMAGGDDYAAIHSAFSRIAVVMLDYSGEKTVSTRHNLTPAKVRWLKACIDREISAVQIDSRLEWIDRKVNYALNCVKAVSDNAAAQAKSLLSSVQAVGTGMAIPNAEVTVADGIKIASAAVEKYKRGIIDEFAYSEEKLNPNKKLENGMSPMSRFSVKRVSFDQTGKPRGLPWLVSIENGEAKPVKTRTGGTAAEKGSYKKVGGTLMMLSDEDMSRLFTSACAFLDAWENLAGQRLISAELKRRADEKNNKGE